MASKYHPPSRRFGDAAQDLEQCAFARALAADNSQDLALLDLETDILERPEFLELVALNGCRPRTTSTVLRATLRISRPITSRKAV
jgi:hypothetical protein